MVAGRSQRRSDGAFVGISIVLTVFVAIIALPSAAIWIHQQFTQGPRSHLVRIELGMHGRESAEPEFLMLDITGECVLGVSADGSKHLIVFQEDEEIIETEGDVAISDMLHWPQTAQGSWEAKGVMGLARSADLIAIDAQFDRSEIWKWHTRPHSVCDDMPLALIDNSAAHDSEPDFP